jgi:elongation factor Ts
MSNLELIKQLRQQTGLGLKEVVKALKATDNDLEKAKLWLRENLKIKISDAKELTEGHIGVYKHHNGQVAAMVYLCCNTDFTARNEGFIELARNIAMHIASANPKWVDVSDIPEDVIAAERELYRKITLDEGKPEKIVDKIVEGRLRKFYQEVLLLEQPFVKEPKKRIKDLIQELAAQTGESITVKGFTRYQVGL